MKIVKFKNGLYGVKSGWWIFSYYLNKWGKDFVYCEENIYEYATFKNIEDAQSAINKYVNDPAHKFDPSEHTEIE
jgi:hypothetical protein